MATKKKRVKSPQQIWEALSSVSVNFVEKIFFSLGVTVARHPRKTIAIALAFVIFSGIGLLRFHIEKNPLNLWVPPDSDFYYDTNWYINTFGTGLRMQNVIVVADDVLQPDVLKRLRGITEEIQSVEIEYDNRTYSISDLCFKVPVVNFFGASFFTSSDAQTDSAKDSVNNSDSDSAYIDSTFWVNDDFYCSFLEKFEMACLRNNLLDMWNNDLNRISNLTKSDILENINAVKVNPLTGHRLDYAKLLGGVKYDNNGKIVAAKSVIFTWYAQVNMSAADLDEVGNLVGTEDWVSAPLALWEKRFLKSMDFISSNSPGLQVLYEAGRSFADVSGEAMFYDVDKLFIGILLMFFYVQFGMSRCNWLEIRLTLGGIGLFCVGMAYISAVSWCSIFRISFGPVHSSLPFLLMGLGIDDMFVMKACWENLSQDELKQSLPIKIGLMLKHAGVSIVITSFTDIVALLIGSITILPSLKSFCIYAAVGVFFIFCYSVTFYVAVVTLDVRRIENNRNGILFCYRHRKEIKINTDKSPLRKLFEFLYKKLIFTIPGKIVVIVFTVVMAGFSIKNVLNLEQRFDPKWFIPDDTYYKRYLDAHDLYYPENGNDAMVFLGEMNYKDEFPALYDTMKSLYKEPFIKEASNWVEYFHRYVQANYKRNLKNTTDITEDEFNTYLSKFLFSPLGGRFQMNFKFTDPIYCGKSTPKLLASTLSFRFSKFHGPETYLPAMHKVKHVVQSANITTGDGYRSVWSKVFGNWVTDEIIAVEVERNIELALVCVMICTVILITNLQMCLWIFICVSLTILNVLGWMQMWGMTVDIVCCIGLELAIGLCVDYAAHVGHTFLTVTNGSRHERAYKTVTSIGTAVVLGGGSTLLSLSLLSMSKAYTFQSFFKIFLLVILFGLFNGVVFLPVVLSLIGPNAYKQPTPANASPEERELNCKRELNSKHNIDDP